MKRVLCLILLIAMIFTLAACGTAEQQAYDFNGNWYSAKDGYLYVFTNGDVFCEENYITLDSGKKTSGGYYEYENYIEAYVIETIGAGADVAPLYLIQEQGSDTLCSDAEGKNIIFCRDAAIAQQIVQQKEKEREEEKRSKKNKLPKRRKIRFSMHRPLLMIQSLQAIILERLSLLKQSLVLTNTTICLKCTNLIFGIGAIKRIDTFKMKDALFLQMTILPKSLNR